ncbi:hypothetical protein BT63DRAFT_427543 [Microthyrium microscopicum]|uniref:Mitochondrial F1F0-ATP synthase g subunit n=1 Tax=Microthyrium microscopicum TaxID=703497 RepID=A0A6A6U4E1_9PEZI|nr:hypothetical protein BT63DRAFT_427543 [Microthyrium microscopicum]
MSLGLSRASLGRQVLSSSRQFISQRSASTASEAASSASQSASNVASSAKEKLGPAASKASEGLSRVTSSAGNALGAAGRALGGIGGRTGRLIGAVQGMIPPTIYYSRVGLEMGKVIFETRSMNPPSVQTFQNYFNSALKTVRNPSTLSNYSPGNLISQFRNLDRQQLTSAGIIGAEVLGFFTIGEMIGRFKVVGYRTSEPAHHDE